MGSVKFFVALEPFETVLRIYWRTFMWYHLCIKDREVLTMEFQKLVTERFSVLEYERRDVAPELVQTILEAGLAAPTACNFPAPANQSHPKQCGPRSPEPCGIQPV